MQFEYTHKQLGKIIIIRNVRTKRFIAKGVKGKIHVTVPYGVTSQYIIDTIEQMKPKLLLFLEKAEEQKTVVFLENDVIKTHSFTAHIARQSMVDKVVVSLKNEKLIISFPEKLDISAPEQQETIRRAVEWGLRMEAKRILPMKTALFAKKHDLSYSDVKINTSKGRWGSCSARKSINYSLYLLLLPEKFIDYVVLHELAHTVEMNHSARFWALLDTFCGTDSKRISQELKAYKTEWADFL